MRRRTTSQCGDAQHGVGSENLGDHRTSQPHGKSNAKRRKIKEIRDMGRRRKLAAIDRLEGNPGHRVVMESGIEALGSPFTPEHLSDDACGVLEVVRLSMPAGVYSALDTFLLSAFATAWAMHKRAALEVS